ncbi:hypothetical protein JHK87_043024 [Glycine soja]|nr:hypothetical protein JHK87_043024 [Glycine soja]
MIPTKDEKRLEELHQTLFVDRSSYGTHCRTGILLESPRGFVLEKALTIEFPLTNNQTKYEVCLAGMEIMDDMEVQVLKVFSNSKLVVNQLNGEYLVKEPILKKYVHKIGVIKEKNSKSWSSPTFQEKRMQ